MPQMEPPLFDTTAGAGQAAYLRIKNYIKSQLAQGTWLPGAQLPSESDLVKQCGVSRMTISRALRELQSEGLVERIQGVGTFASHLFRASSTLRIRDLHEEITERGHQHHVKVHFVRKEKANDSFAVRLGLPKNTLLFHSLIVHYENGIALQCEDRYVNPDCAPDYLTVDFNQITPTHYLLKVAPMWEAQFSIEAGTAAKEEAKLLGIHPQEPCLVLTRKTINRNMPITIARLVYPGTRYQIQGQFKP